MLIWIFGETPFSHSPTEGESSDSQPNCLVFGVCEG
jgi:hypothetical protein